MFSVGWYLLTPKEIPFSATGGIVDRVDKIWSCLSSEQIVVMCEQTEINYLDGEVVWVKLGSCWWPGEVVAPEKLPPDVLPSFRKPPIAVVKFFQEETFEYVKNINSIYKYNCSRKNEFINKGLYMYRTKHGPMEKFPEDVIRAETAVGGDIEILTRDEFQEPKKESYAGIFGDQKKTPVSTKKGRGRGRPSESPRNFTPTPIRKIKEKTDYKVHILVQGSTTPSRLSTEAASNPSTSGAELENSEEKSEATAGVDNETTPQTPEKSQNGNKPASSFTTPTISSSGMYSCHACSFSTARLNVLILHNKTHSVTFTPYTPSSVKKKTTKSAAKSTPSSSKTPKTPRPRKEKAEKPPKKQAQGQKRSSEDQKTTAEVKKPKTDQEIKSSLLADWDDVDEEYNDESSAMVRAESPEVAAAAESPAVPTPAEVPSPQVPLDIPIPGEVKTDGPPTADKPESSSDSKYEFCEDEDWPVEADVGRKIPRIKNPSKRKDETKSVSLDDDEMAREVAELLTKTTVPELPSVPEPLKVEENFPEPSVVKSPDKQEASAETNKTSVKVTDTPPTKAIFKTKTFFRSRHSRSQDAIGKYVAEQLNIVERMDMSENEINGSDVVSSPEARESPPIEPVKVARLAPKIQLKKMKAEAAQLREKEKLDMDFSHDDPFAPKIAEPIPNISLTSPTVDSTVDTASPNSLAIKTSEIIASNTCLKPNTPMLELSVNPLTSKLEISTKSTGTTVETSFITSCLSLDTVNQETESSVEHTNLSSESILKSVSPVEPITETENVSESVVTMDTIDTDSALENQNTENIVQDVLYPTQEIKPITEELPQEGRAALTNEKIVNEEVMTNEDVTSKIEVTDQTVKDLPESDLKENLEVVSNVFYSTDLEIKEPSVNIVSKKSEDPYMNESTASAVDALLSVSRETDRVTRVISDDLPEDLFEDDIRDSGTINANGLNEITIEENVVDTPQLENKDPPLAGNGLENGLNNYEPVESEQVHVETEQIVNSELCEEQCVTVEDQPTTHGTSTNTIIENIPSESDLQIAEALINLPSTAIQSKTSDHQDINMDMQLETTVGTETEIAAKPENLEGSSNIPELVEENKTCMESILNQENVTPRFETELEESENLNAAQSLVQMSESIDHKISIVESNKSLNTKEIPETEAFSVKQNNGLDSSVSIEQKVASLSNDNSNEPSKPAKYETTCSKLLKILEEPCTPKVAKTTPTKQIVIPGKEKILNFDVAKSTFKPKHPSKSPVIIRRAVANKHLINNVNEKNTAEKIILSRTNKASQDGSAVQTYTIQTSPDAPSDTNTITIIQQKVRKITKPATKLQKIKPQNSLITPIKDNKPTKQTTVVEDAMFDINSMPIVLSDDILTPESIEKMPIVMSDGNLITNTQNPPKLIKTKKPVIEPEKPTHSTVVNKPEIKTLVMNPATEVNKVATPNILSKSAKLRGAKPMLVIDKATGKQKIIMTKAEPTTVKEIKPAPTFIQSVPQNTGKPEKFIILPTTSQSPRPGRTQKIVIDPQTGKAHVLVAKGPDTTMNLNDNKPVSAKLIPSASDATSPGNTVMIITNAQGAQSRIVLTSEHEKILFPNKQQPNVSQLKTITHRMPSVSATSQKTIVSAVPQIKTQTRIVPKQKSAIITSKGQLIVGGRVATAAQNIAPMPEIRPVQKRIIAAEPKKLVQTIQKTNSEPLIFLQQKSGAVVQLTPSQFEHFQRTGQIIQKIPLPAQEKPVIQKTITISSGEPLGNVIQKPRVRKTIMESPAPAKKVKHEIAIAPAPPPVTPMPVLTPLSNTVVTTLGPSISNTVSVTTTTSYQDLDNLEEMLPSTAIARQPEPVVSQPEPPAAPLSDGQLLAVPGEHFGGPPGSFYLCVEDNGTLTPIDNRPLVLENNQLVPMAVEPLPMLAPQPERRDILEAALANSDVFHAEPPRDEAPDFRDLNANVSVHCCVSETSTTLNQPIMTPVEVPSKGESEPTVPSNLEDGLAVIGVTPHTVPTSLELPITVTDPRIAPKTTDPLSGTNYGATLLPSPNTEMTYITREEVEVPVGGPIHMPLLTDDEPSGKSMPILTDEVAERTVSSLESAAGSPSSLDVRESEPEEGGQWSRRLLTPGSDISETSSEIPLQPSIQLSVNEMSRHS